MKQVLAAALALAFLASAASADPLPSWTEGAAKTRIVDFVETVTDPASPDYVTPADRIAVFDNDGTLWSEQPTYFQLIYAVDRLREQAQDDPAIMEQELFRSVLESDIDAVMEAGETGLVEVVMQSHAGPSVSEFIADVRDWLETARHPQTGLPYTDMTYQPMVELLRYLRDEGFSTYIVSGGGIHFVRALSDDAYGIPTEQVIGSTGKTRYDYNDGNPILAKDAGIVFIDDGPGKPVGIDGKIGKRPIFAAGNSDGDLQMLQWTTAGDGPRFGMIVHHTDGAREWAYDRNSHIGRLDKALDAAPENGWLVVDMAKDWQRIWTGQPR